MKYNKSLYLLKSLLIIILLVLSNESFADVSSVLIGKWIPEKVIDAEVSLDGFYKQEFLRDGVVLVEDNPYGKWEILDNGSIKIKSSKGQVFFAEIKEEKLVVNMLTESVRVGFGKTPKVMYKKIQ
jgi:hypothetical protein